MDFPEFFLFNCYGKEMVSGKEGLEYDVNCLEMLKTTFKGWINIVFIYFLYP